MAGYGDDIAFAAFLASNGYTLPVGAPASAVLRQRGSAYLDGLYGARLAGAPTDGLAQERAWPRTGATAYCTTVPSDLIPVQWVNASYYAALHEAENPGSLAVAASAAGAVRREREKVDVIETEKEYFAGSGDAAKDATVTLSAVEGLVAPFLISELTSGFVAIRSIGR